MGVLAGRMLGQRYADAGASPPDGGVRVALRDESEDVGLTLGEGVESCRGRPRPDQCLDYLGVEGNAAAGDPLERVVELVEAQWTAFLAAARPERSARS
jgi:hypothetical protein